MENSIEPADTEVLFSDHDQAVNASFLDFFFSEKFTDLIVGSSEG
jgi:hypothetical protein